MRINKQIGIDCYKEESKIFLPNEIFSDFQACIKTVSHLAFAYSYVYFITWLYRYAKYFNSDVIIDNKKIKEFLGYNPNQQTLDYLIKKNGLLDTIGYTESTRDYPIQWSYSRESGLTFFMRSEVDKVAAEYLPKVPARYFLKKPVKAFRRIINENGEEYETEGVFYDVSNTHMIPFEVFLFCMSKNNIGCVGFYLYGYLKHKNDISVGGYDASLDSLSKETCIPRRTLVNYLSALRSHRVVEVIHNQEYFSVGIEKGERKVSTYVTNDPNYFSDMPVPYKRIDFKSKADHHKLMDAEKRKVSYVDDILF